jgi:hypothetical protein
MARKKADEIAELKKRLRVQTDLYTEAEPLLPIAEALREAINARLVGDSGHTPLDVDTAFDAALTDVAERIIASKLETLDPETVLRLYAEHVGDDVLRDKLGSWADAKANELDAEQRRVALLKASAGSGRVALKDIDEGVRVAVGMFDPLHIGRARRESSIPPERTITFRLLDPSRGQAEMISDIALAGRAHTGLTAHARANVGSLVVEGDERWLEPALQLHAPLGYDLGDGPASSPEIIGFVEVGDGVLIVG